MIWLPTFEQVLLLHQKLVDASIGACGARDPGLIESALARAQAAFAGVEAHEGVIRKAAAVGCELTQNHGFVDGNKRIGMAVMLLILWPAYSYLTIRTNLSRLDWPLPAKIPTSIRFPNGLKSIRTYKNCCRKRLQQFFYLAFRVIR